LLDAHVSRPILAHLESIGHDCLHAATLPPTTSDREIMERAVREGRVIVTADKDFGELAFRGKFAVAGVVLLRLRLATEIGRTARLVALWPRIERAVPGHFVTVTNHRIRRRILPTVS
jgi:hypothetical protein